MSVVSRSPRPVSGGRTVRERALRPTVGQPPTMGYQPSLDGVRAVSVVAVLLYHAGFEWMHGGFLGVEVFFVVSGFLITSLLLDERERSGRIVLRAFWLRRARRLLPALFMVLLAIGLWAALFGSAQMRSDLRRDYPWGIFYAANWGQIFGGAQYFGNLSPLRHLWSLAVEEQWYLLWPLAFVALSRTRWRTAERGRIVLGCAALVMIVTWFMARSPELTDDRVNLLYLSTFTRASGLLLGAGAAFVWRPWRSPRRPVGSAGPVLDIAGVAAAVVLLISFASVSLVDRSLYRWQLALASVASLVVVAVVVHPASRLLRPACSWTPLVEIGKRSYGLYLWSWPISVVAKAYTGSWPRFIGAMLVTAMVAELSYRYVETPVRHGAIGRWLKADRSIDWRRTAGCASVAVIALLVPLGAFYKSVDHFDPAAGGDDVAFDLDLATTPTLAGQTQIATPEPTSPVVEDASDETTSNTTQQTAEVAETTSSVAAVVPEVTAPVLPRRLVIVGDSQAHSLAINLPEGIESTFDIADGSVEGCGVADDGSVRSERDGFSRSFGNCSGWAGKWADAAVSSNAEVALVVIGAWDVFDVEVGDQLIEFGTPAADERFLTDLREGVAALSGAGVHVALLEIACMRPQDVDGAGVPALPERGDDQRIAHLNDLMRRVADENPSAVTFVAGPTQWCNDPAVSSDLGYRWDGVHVYKPGAKLIYETIAPALLAIPIAA
jgi:peptidoglycan/LPS O-acetylase OafA/YrhL